MCAHCTALKKTLLIVNDPSLPVLQSAGSLGCFSQLPAGKQRELGTAGLVLVSLSPLQAKTKLVRFMLGLPGLVVST